MHELYFDRVVILIQKITTWSKYNECMYYYNIVILQLQLDLLYFISKYDAGDKNISSVLRKYYFGFGEKKIIL